MSAPLLMRCSICLPWPVVTSIDFEMKVLVKILLNSFTRSLLKSQFKPFQRGSSEEIWSEVH